jgi:hypothetical protein
MQAFCGPTAVTATLAQLVEHSFRKAGVLGSSPRGGYAILVAASVAGLLPLFPSSESVQSRRTASYLGHPPVRTPNIFGPGLVFLFGGTAGRDGVRMAIHFDADGFKKKIKKAVEDKAETAFEQTIREKLVQALGPADAAKISVTPEGTFGDQISFRIDGPEDLKAKIRALNIKLSRGAVTQIVSWS